MLRYGLALVFLYFGFSQLFDGIHRVAFVPDWIVQLVHLPPAMIVLANGAFEVVCGVLFILGIGVPYIALVLALHMAAIVGFIGINPIGVRDFGITIATIALGLLEWRKHE